MNRDPQLTQILRRISIWLGVAILLISIYLSYDGFDGSVSGSNQYTILAKIIGFVFAIAVSTLQFIFSTDFKGLNKTLKFVGLFSYVYSIYTNKLGAVSLLGMSEEMAWTTAIFADIVAEPMIAWGLGEAAIGDFIGNMTKSLFGSERQDERHDSKQSSNRYNTQTPVQSTKYPTHNAPSSLPRKQQGFDER